MHETTHHSIRQLWERLVMPQVPAAAGNPAPANSATSPAGLRSLDDRIQLGPEHAFAPVPAA